MPTIKSCNASDYGQPFNVTYLETKGVSFEVRWNWDGTSVWPACDGPLANGQGQGNGWAVKAVNTNTHPMYARTIRKNGQPVVYTIQPGQTVTLTVNQASSAGYTVYSDFIDLNILSTEA